MKTEIQYQILAGKIIGQIFDGETQCWPNVVIPITEEQESDIRLGIISKNQIENWILDAAE
jgi:hypothetical protein